MKTIRLVLVSVVVLAAGAAQAFDVFLPPAGEDLFPATNARVMVQDPQGMMHDLMCSGPTRVMRSGPMGRPPMMEIETELLQLDLACSNGIMIHLANTGRKSMGMTMSNGDSFFDVFVEISLPMSPTNNHTGTPGPEGPPTDGPPPLMLRNCDALRMQSIIGHVPPLHSMYFGGPIPLFANCDPPNQPIAQLVSVQHDVNSVPKPESSGEFSQIFSCFYECKRRPCAGTSCYNAIAIAQNPWQEITTLMLVNQSPAQLLRAHILFVDGRQTPIAKTVTSLSPLDLDEINVCETLERGGVAVPSAGMIEVVLSPTGGAYGWVKNLSGKFQRGVAEPFDNGQNVTGIGKTECRLVGPNVATPQQLESKFNPEVGPPPPAINAILIENTADGTTP